jgi:hypothetical protein
MPEPFDVPHPVYRVGVQHFAHIIAAECYKLDEPIAKLARLPIELWYKSRWNVMGNIPEAKRVPT